MVVRKIYFGGLVVLEAFIACFPESHQGPICVETYCGADMCLQMAYPN